MKINPALNQILPQQEEEEEENFSAHKIYWTMAL